MRSLELVLTGIMTLGKRAYFCGKDYYSSVLWSTNEKGVTVLAKWCYALPKGDRGMLEIAT